MAYYDVGAWELYRVDGLWQFDSAGNKSRR